jgi:hypothetical protein
MQQVSAGIGDVLQLPIGMYLVHPRLNCSLLHRVESGLALGVVLAEHSRMRGCTGIYLKLAQAGR